MTTLSEERLPGCAAERARAGFAEQGTHHGAQWGSRVDTGKRRLWVEEKNITEKAAGGHK